jgi:uncharacterized protein YcfJ
VGFTLNGNTSLVLGAVIVIAFLGGIIALIFHGNAIPAELWVSFSAVVGGFAGGAVVNKTNQQTTKDAGNTIAKSIIDATTQNGQKQ